jgi:TetR/AcrR family transcriptional repressor of nem operon
MKVSREQAAENRERILEVAAKLFREQGYEGISVADLMGQAGLTHGGFYGHFASKEELMAEASTRAFADTLKTWSDALEGGSANPLGDIARTYLSTTHRDHPGHGCVVAALAVDASRQGPRVRHALTEGLRAHVETLTKMMPDKSTEARREKALATYASFIGALVLARAVDDPVLSKAFLHAVEATTAQEK